MQVCHCTLGNTTACLLCPVRQQQIAPAVNPSTIPWGHIPGTSHIPSPAIGPALGTPMVPPTPPNPLQDILDRLKKLEEGGGR